jgi:hypothetical protein
VGITDAGWDEAVDRSSSTEDRVFRSRMAGAAVE